MEKETQAANTFSNQKSVIYKGIAILFLLVHHTILNYTPKSPSTGSYFSASEHIFFFTKITLSIFVILSGYGIHRSFQKALTRYKSSKLMEDPQINYTSTSFIAVLKQIWFGYRYIVPRILSILMIYWVNYILATLFFLLRFGDLTKAFKSNIILNGLYDFLGLATFTHTKRISNAWWYVSIIIIYYLIFPLLYQVFQRSPNRPIYAALWVILLTAFPLFLPSQTYFFYGYQFALGMVISRWDLIDQYFWPRFTNCRKLTIQLLSFTLLITALLFIKHYYIVYLPDPPYRFMLLDGLITLCGFFFIGLLSQLKWLTRPLYFIGKYSYEIYLTHGVLIRGMYPFIFADDVKICVIIRLLIITLPAAYTLQHIIQFLRIPQATNALRKKLES